MSLTLNVLNSKKENVGSVQLAENVFNAKGSQALVHEVVTAYLANERRGTHATKTRGEVSGGGLKPWKQKGTGRARSGSTRSPLWRGGGVTFGPQPRSYVQAVPPAKRRAALRTVLSGFVREGKLSVVDKFDVSEPKTKLAVALIKGLGVSSKSVVVVDALSAVTLRAVKNIPNLRLFRARDLTSYEALLGDDLIVTQKALEELTERLGDKTSTEVAS